MKLFVKNLKGISSVLWFRQLLEELQLLHEPDMRLGEIILPSFIQNEKLLTLKRRLEEKGFEIIYDRKRIIVEQVKLIIYELLAEETPPTINYSKYISNKLFLNYTYLANVFAEMEAITIEHYIIEKKIEKGKGLLRQGHNIGEIAEMLHYSSIGHFSNQFKKVSGSSPTEFRRIQRPD